MKATSLKGLLCISFFAQDRSASSAWDDRGLRAPRRAMSPNTNRCGVLRFTQRRTVAKDSKTHSPSKASTSRKL